jgi:hypothetical protein
MNRILHAFLFLLAAASWAHASEWASSQVMLVDPSDPWFISAPTQLMADNLAQGVNVSGKRLQRNYPGAKFPESCQAKIFANTNYVGGVVGREQTTFKGRAAYKSEKRTKEIPPSTPAVSCVRLAVQAKVQGGDLLDLNYCVQDTCPKAVREDFAKILSTLNPGKPAPPTPKAKKKAGKRAARAG